MIADDHKLFREGIKALLAITDDIEIVGEAEDGHAALQKSQELQPDVILMDIHMPGLNGLQATGQILEKQPQTHIIMLTMLEDDASVFHAMRMGARGYLLKGADPQEVLSVIRAVAEGQALFGPAIAARLMNFFKELHTKPASETAPPFPELTDRELEVLRLIAQGLNNQEITRKLVLSPKTVRNHITNIFSKMQVADRAQAIVRAREAGLN
jgi:DNA-binding NarL/FixJ family response regulator